MWVRGVAIGECIVIDISQARGLGLGEPLLSPLALRAFCTSALRYEMDIRNAPETDLLVLWVFAANHIEVPFAPHGLAAIAKQLD